MNKFARSLIGAAFLTLAGGAAGPSFAETPKDSLVMAWQFDDIISLDPAEIFEFSGAEYSAQVYDRLVGIDLRIPARSCRRWRKAGRFPTMARLTRSRSATASSSIPAIR